MAQQSYWMIFIIILISMLSHTQCHPLPKHDLISGRDFLSLFLDNEAETENFPKRNAKNLRRIFHTYHNDNQADNVLPIEAIFSDELIGESSTYYHDSSISNSNNRKKKKAIDQPTLASSELERETQDLALTTSTETSSNILSTDVESSNRHIQLVTSGSKIIFFEDEASEREEKDPRPEEEDSSTNTTEASNSDARVISVRVSSSVGMGQQTVEKVERKNITTTSTTLPPFIEDIAYETGGHLISSEESFIEDVAHETGGQLISNSHKSEFSIEEEDSYTRTKDSMNGESTTVHQIVAPPLQRSDEDFNSRTYAPHNQPKSRMQRKQDSIVPYQTIIYHDDSSKEEDSKLKPISFSSTGQTGGDLQTWKDIDTFLRNKMSNKTEMETSATMMSAQYSQPEQVYSEPAKVYSEPSKVYSEPSKVYSEPSKVYSEPSKIYSEPSKVYSEPAKVYSQPERVYGEPAKIYSEPSKVYSEPAKNYGLPAKVYSKPSQIWHTPPTTPVPNESRRQVIHNLDKLPYDELNAPADENQRKSLLSTIGKFAPKQPSDQDKMPPQMMMAKVEATSTTTPNPSNVTDNPIDDTKVGYVVEGENYRKYRVEEKTPDGFIVGEYGVLSHNDGSLRGVRYTADSNINPRLIHDALVKFLSL